MESSSLLKKITSLTGVLTVLGTLIVPFAGQAAEMRLDLGAFDHARSNELMVRYQDGHIESQTFDSTSAAAQAMISLKQNDDVASVQPNFLYHASGVVNDPLASSQPYLETDEAYQAWDINHDAHNVVVAIIDSGVDINHEDLKANIWLNPKESLNNIDDDRNGYIDDTHGWNFVGNDNDVRPDAPRGIPENSIGIQHGTGVAGIIAASGDNNIGITGIAWNAKIMSLRVLDEYGVGDSKTVTRALEYAIDNGANVINMSLVGTDYDPLTIELMKKAHDKGIIVVAAAGNNGFNLNNVPTYPVCYNDAGAATVIGVGAIDTSFDRPSFSNFGSDCVDIVAPGVKIFTTRYSLPYFDIKDRYAALFSGTSFAAPQVSGVVALLKGMRPDLTPEQVLYLLQQGSTRIDASQHVVASGFDFALNAAGSLSLLSTLPVVEVQPPTEAPSLILKHPEFLAYSRGANQGSAYQYQFPGPVVVSPVVFTEDALKSGMRFAKEGHNRVFVSAWKADSKFLWRYDANVGQFSQVLMIPIDDDQTVGSVAIGNVDFDPHPELVIASGPQSKPRISVYTLEGVKKYEFQPYSDDITGGLDVALADVNDDGLMEIVVVPVSQTSGHIKVFDYTGLVLNQWDAYGANFHLGASLSVTDIDKDGLPDIIVGPGQGGGPHVRIFDRFGHLESEFFAGEVGESSGAIVDFYDLDQDQTPEFVVSYHSGHQSIIRTYSVSGVFQEELGVFDPSYKGAIGVVPL